MKRVETSALSLPPHVVLISIGAFWTFYFSIWSLRAVVLYNYHHSSMLGTRAIVSLGSAGMTLVFYLLMRRVSAENIGRSIGLALLLAIPAAIAYSAFNWFMFDYLADGSRMSWSWSAPSSMTAHLDPPKPPAPPSPGSMTLSVGMMPAMPQGHMTPLQSIADGAGNGYFFFIAWAALYLALCYAAEILTLERRTAELRMAAQSSELRALRYQVNPHFLFNTLNSLSSLVLSDKREAAEQMIINLATFFRTSLTDDPTEDVPLSDEIMLQRLYLDIEFVRFPDRLLTEIDVPDALRAACIPGLILQPLVENAVKHAVARSKRPVTIRISACLVAAGIRLSVEDDGEPIAIDVDPGIGVGLSNVRDRLAARFGSDAMCRWHKRPGGGFAVELTMPLVQHGC